MKLKYPTLIFMAIVAVACNRQSETFTARQIENAVDSFATNYFNWHFLQAAQFVTDSSQVWLHYAASQVHQADIEILREKEDATVEIEGITTTAPTTASVLVTVRNFLGMDTIGTEGHIVHKARFSLPVEEVQEQGKRVWKIRMASLPQNGKQSRD